MAKEKTLIEKVKAKVKYKPRKKNEFDTTIVIERPKTGATPFPWTEELEKEIAEYIATHAVSLNKSVENNPHWPKANLIFERIHKNPIFGDMYSVAKQSQVLVMNEKTMDVLDEVRQDPELVPWGREAIKQYNWQAARLKPRTFGDKSFVENTNITQEDSLDELK